MTSFVPRVWCQFSFTFPKAIYLLNHVVISHATIGMMVTSLYTKFSNALYWMTFHWTYIQTFQGIRLHLNTSSANWPWASNLQLKCQHWAGSCLATEQQVKNIYIYIYMLFSNDSSLLLACRLPTDQLILKLYQKDELFQDCVSGTGTIAYLSSYPGYLREPLWKSIGLPDISRVTWQVCNRSGIYCSVFLQARKCLSYI